MAERASVFQTTQLGVESTSGTIVAANRQLLCTSILPKPMVPVEAYRPIGFKAPTTAYLRKEWTEADVKGVLCYNDIVYLLTSLLTAATITTPTGGTLSRQWKFIPSATAPDSPNTFTVESGTTGGQAERFGYGYLDTLAIRYTKDEVGISGKMVGQNLIEGITLTSSPTIISENPVDPEAISIFVGNSYNTNKVMSVSVGGASAGNFTLTWVDPAGVSRTTANIAYNANTAAMQTALDTLFGGGNTVAASSAPWTVTVQGVFAGVDVSTMTMNATGLTGASGPAVTVSTAGGMTQLVRVLETELSLTNRFNSIMTLDATKVSFSATVERAPQLAAKLSIEHDSTSVSLMADLRAKTTKYATIMATGAVIEGALPYRCNVLFPFKFKESPRADKDDVWTAEYGLYPIYDSTLGSYLNVTVQNKLTAL